MYSAMIFSVVSDRLMLRRSLRRDMATQERDDLESERERERERGDYGEGVGLVGENVVV